MKKIICITGASSGIGHHFVGFALESGYEVIATVRKESDQQKLLSHFPSHLHVIIMDIAVEQSRQAAYSEVQEILKGRKLFALVNNAGIVAPGPLLFLPLGDIRYQFEVNVFGLLGWTQLLCSDITNTVERIVNISSVSGLITSPFTGAYSMSKFSVEALSDGLRREMNAWGTKVIVIQPGPIKTPIWQKSIQNINKFRDTPYRSLLEHAEDVVSNTEKNAILPIAVSRTIIKALTASRPKTRYIVAKRPWAYWAISRLCTDKWLDYLILKKRPTEGSQN